MDIQQWLKSEQDYETGVQLYEEHGTKETYKQLFRLRKSSFSEKKLLDLLQEIAREQAPAEPEPEKEKHPPKVLELIRLRSVLHQQLFHLTAKSDRHKIAKQILAIGDKLDRWYQKGEMPLDEETRSIEADIPANAWEMHLAFGSNRAYITKNKKSEDKQGEVSRREQQNALIEERLKSMNYGTVQE
jgi:tRNA nucleotidyltransferase/poly(A) polymerase